MLFVRSASLYALMVLLIAAVVMIGNHGHFTFILDDPYIHLAMAENLPVHPGINLEEVTDASSSILYPWLLCPFARSEALGLVAALVINLAAGFGCLYFLARMAGNTRQGWLWAVSLVVFAAGFNLFTLVFMGMEHTLHVMLSLGILCGLHEYEQKRSLPHWFWACFFLAPLVRYEGLALDVLVVLWLLLDRRWLWATAGSIAVVIPQALHALWLKGQGLPALPTSVLLKSDTISYNLDDFGFMKLAVGMFYDFFSNFIQTPAQMAAGLLAVALLLLAFLAPNSRRLCFVVSLTILAHFFLGRTGWLGRYTAYIDALGMCALLLATRPWLEQKGRWTVLYKVAVLSLLALVAMPNIDIERKIPQAAAQIYEQPWQLRRLLIDYWKAPVLAIDIGAVSWGNSYAVWDVTGLASESIRKFISGAGGMTSEDFLLEMSRQHQAGLALLLAQRDIVPPASWVPLARIALSASPVILHQAIVIYATSEQAVPAAKAAILAWRTGLPPQVPIALNQAVFSP